jgi:hypothetical protein
MTSVPTGGLSGMARALGVRTPATSSLRDYLAGQAMQGLIAAGEILTLPALARQAYAMADAMLLERRRGAR